jgi:Predicted signal transduction protein with a C-terminal ATPase domain
VFFSRLANKLILTFTLTIFIFIAALIFVSYNRTNDILINDFINANKSILRLLNINYENYIAQIDELSVNVRKDTQFMEILSNNSMANSDEKYIQNQIKILFYSRDDIEKLQFYIPGSGKLYSISRTHDKLLVEYDPDLVRQQWYRNTVQGEYFRYIEPLVKPLNDKAERSFSDDEKALFTFHRALVSIPGWRPLGIISISFNRLLLNKMMTDTFNQKGEAVCIYDRNNQPFYFSNSGFNKIAIVRDLMKLFGKGDSSGHFQLKIGNHDYLAVFDRSEHNEWQIVKLIPLSLLKNKVRQTRNISFLIGGIFIFLFIILIITVSNTITQPLRRLSRQMAKVGAGNFDVNIEVRGNDEIARLSERFNFMVNQVHELIHEKYLAQINEKTARLKALEAQINPHFLYNSLQAIATKAVIHGMKDVSEMIEALAYILRYCIKGGDQVKLSEELKHIRKYLLLQKVRYEERLAVEICALENLSDILIPKLSIQILVENSVQHAVEHMTRAITIRIDTYTVEDEIVIKVTDDGPGMTPEHLERVVREMNDSVWLDKSEASIGLKNLYSRLKLMYSEKARLVIESIPGKGTEASIILPLNPGDDQNA